MNSIKITEHAYKRGEQRFNLGRKSLERLAEKAFLLGIRRRDSRGTLRRYFEEKRPYSNSLRIYGNYVFAFNYQTLLTCYQLPSEMIKFVVKPNKRRRLEND